MKTLNTKIGTTSNGTKLISFTGSNFSKPCSIIIENNVITASYNDKRNGLMTNGSLLSLRVRKAIAQKYDNKNIVTIEEKEFSSPMEVIKFVKNLFNTTGSLLDNATILN